MKSVNDKIIEAPNLSVIGSEHINKWVALSPDYKKLLAVGESLQTVLKNAKYFADKVVIKVLPNLGYAPTAY